MTPREGWTLLVVTAAVVLLSGCQLRSDVAVTVDGDGAGTLAVTVAADDELRAAAARVDADPLTTLAAAVEGQPGWQVERPDDGSAQRVTLTTTFADPDELRAVSGEFADALAAPELRPLEPFEVVVDDATVTLRGAAALDLTGDVAAPGVAPARARALLAESTRLRVRAAMPGDVLETNADERPGDRAVVWEIPAGERRELVVTSHRPWTWARIVDALRSPAGMVAVAVLALLMGGAIALVLRRRRRGRGAGGAVARGVAVGPWRGRGPGDAPVAQAFAPSRSARMRSRSLRT